MTIRDWCIGAGAGNAVGGLIGVAVLPLGWLTVIFAIVALVGAYICQAAWKWETKDAV